MVWWMGVGHVGVCGSCYQGLCSGSHHCRIHVRETVNEDDSCINVDQELRDRDLHDSIATKPCNHTS